MAKEKQEQICPVCGETTKDQLAWITCPQMDMSICSTHCLNNCRYLKKGTSLVRCVYRHKYLT